MQRRGSSNYQSVSTYICRFQGKYAEQEMFSLSFNHPPPLTSFFLWWQMSSKTNLVKLLWTQHCTWPWDRQQQWSNLPNRRTYLGCLCLKMCFIGNPLEIIKVENKSIGHSREKSRHEKHFEEEENIFHPSHYSPFGCPTLPIAFAGAYILLLKL